MSSLICWKLDLKHRTCVARSRGSPSAGRRIATDTLGLPVGVVAHAAYAQGRDGAPDVPTSIRARWPRLRHGFADAGCAGDKLQAALADKGRWALEIIRRSDMAEGFKVRPRRWGAERTCAWLGRRRRLAKDWEKTIASATACLLLAHIRFLTWRIPRHCQA